MVGMANVDRIDLLGCGGVWTVHTCNGAAAVRPWRRLVTLPAAATSAVRAVTRVPDSRAGRDRLRDVLQDPRLP
jgi:hypothetical protein